MELPFKQTKFIDEIEDQTSDINELILAGGSGTGKSLVCMYYVIKMCLKYDGAVVALVRSEATRLKRATMDTFREVCKIQNLIDGEHYRYRENMNDILFPNGSKILLVNVDYRPSDPNYQYLRGYQFTSVYCDEASEISLEAWKALKLRIRWKLDEFGIKAKIFGSCNPNKGWLYNEFYKANKEGLLLPNRYFDTLLPEDNPFQSKEYWKILQEGTPQQIEIYWKGNWEADTEGELIDYDKIIELPNNTWVREDKNKQYYITADIALQGSDKAVIILWYGFEIIGMKVYSKSSIQDIQQTINQYKNKYKIPSNNIILDSDGVGNGLPDLFKVKGFVNNSKALNDENYFNLKTQCYYILAKYINDGAILINDGVFTTKQWEELVVELGQVKSDLPKSGKLTIISKDKVKGNIGRSPDYADAIMMRMWFTLNKNTGIYAF